MCSVISQCHDSSRCLRCGLLYQHIISAALFRHKNSLSANETWVLLNLNGKLMSFQTSVFWRGLPEICCLRLVLMYVVLVLIRCKCEFSSRPLMTNLFPYLNKCKIFCIVLFSPSELIYLRRRQSHKKLRKIKLGKAEKKLLRGWS